MRRFGNLFQHIISHRNLWRAWRDFRRGKRGRPSVCANEMDADRRILRLRRALLAKTYKPGAYRFIMIREPKRRLIAAAPVLDRIIHHAVHRVVAPLIEPRLIATTFACIKNRGTHRALYACLQAMRGYQFRLSLDMRHYFLSIDRSILLKDLARHIKDQDLMGLLRTLAESGDGIYQQKGVAEYLGLEPGFPPKGCGLPIGNLTSQWWGNLYLNGFDHFVKRELHIPHYQRYMDDLTLFSNSRQQLIKTRNTITEWLWQERRLTLKHPMARVYPCTAKWVYLGHEMSRVGVKPTGKMLVRMQHRITRLLTREDGEALARSMASYRGVLFPMEPGI
ncbi:MAG: RNA-directed DNA polymerase [Planctomycetota bacterium]